MSWSITASCSASISTSASWCCWSSESASLPISTSSFSYLLLLFLYHVFFLVYHLQADDQKNRCLQNRRCRDVDSLEAAVRELGRVHELTDLDAVVVAVETSDHD